MASADHDVTTRTALRLWPGVIAVVLQWLIMFGLPAMVPGQGGTGILGGMAGALAVAVWWLFFSRAAWSERLGWLAIMVVAVAATRRLVHPSIANGMMGLMLFIYAAPVLSLALVAWAAASRRLAGGGRIAAMVAAVVLACGTLTLIRTNGISGDANSDVAWRWTPTPEQRLLARPDDAAIALPSVPAPAAASPLETAPSPPPPASSAPPASATAATETPDQVVAPPAATAAIWPGFRGPNRDGIIRGTQIETDWSRTPPVEIWRRPIGPGWSSFAVAGDRIYTQEQRGDDENVSCYDLNTGKPVWRHRDAARFWESNAGPGPRATPTLSHGRVYTFGATGILNALDARSGAVVWSRNAASDTGRKIPAWGFASSPLVVDDLVIVAPSGQLAAYDLVTGKPRWYGEYRGGSYSSPHLITVDGVLQVVLLSGSGASSVSPSDGRLLWEQAWEGVPIVQPATTGDGDVLITSGDMSGGAGTRRIALTHGAGKWSAVERWTSLGLKPYFNDIVVHKGHAFGFDGSILASINLEDGKRDWKGGRYGHGQLVLLSDQDVLLVLSEEGELALVRATPEQFTEVARFKAIEGKTWNHPVLVGDILLVRNGEEMAAFRLPVSRR